MDHLVEDNGVGSLHVHRARVLLDKLILRQSKSQQALGIIKPRQSRAAFPVDQGHLLGILLHSIQPAGLTTILFTTSHHVEIRSCIPIVAGSGESPAGGDPAD